MKPSTVDITYLYDAFLEQAEQLIEQWRCQPEGTSGENPSHLVEAMVDLCGLLKSVDQRGMIETDTPVPGEREAETLGNYGLQLLVDLSDLATQIGMADCSQELEDLCLPLAAWVARQGGEIRLLPPVVNTLARHANQTTNPQKMMELYNLATEVFHAVSPHVIDSNPEDPMHPWRLLVINRAIIATRTLEPTIMEPALKAVVEHLPEDAPRFFEEGMNQMDKIGYPEQVREVMHRYHILFGEIRTLH